MPSPNGSEDQLVKYFNVVLKKLVDCQKAIQEIEESDMSDDDKYKQLGVVLKMYGLGG